MLCLDPPFIFCVTPETPILRTDLSWTAAGDLHAGDEIVGFNEHSTRERNRRFCRSIITTAGSAIGEIYEIQLEGGQVLRSTGEHQWLTRLNALNMSEWVRTDDLARRMSHHNRKHPLALLQYVPNQHHERTWETGLLSAAFDGEGCLSVSQKDTRKQCTNLFFCQNENVFLDQVLDTLNYLGFPTTGPVHNKYSRNTQTFFTGGLWEKLRFLMLVRPPRLLDSFKRIGFERLTMHGRPVRITSVKYVGDGPVSMLTSSSQTYIAAGFGAHNSTGINRIIGTKRFFMGSEPIETEYRKWSKEEIKKPTGPADLLNHTRTVMEQATQISRQGLIIKGQDLIVSKPDWWSYHVYNLGIELGLGEPAEILIQHSKAHRMADKRWKNQYHFRRAHCIYLCYKWS